MAGATNPLKSAWPFGEHSLYPITLRSEATGGDSSGYKIEDVYRAEFDFRVKQAYFSVREGSVAITGAILVKVQDDTGTPQQIISARNITAADDAGNPVALTVNDEGPILTGANVELSLDSNTSDTIQNLKVVLLVEPVYR